MHSVYVRPYCIEPEYKTCWILQIPVVVTANLESHVRGCMEERLQLMAMILENLHPATNIDQTLVTGYLYKMLMQNSSSLSGASFSVPPRDLSKWS